LGVLPKPQYLSVSFKSITFGIYQIYTLCLCLLKYTCLYMFTFAGIIYIFYYTKCESCSRQQKILLNCFLFFVKISWKTNELVSLKFKCLHNTGILKVYAVSASLTMTFLYEVNLPAVNFLIYGRRIRRAKFIHSIFVGRRSME
jgi:hypothetical protein